MAPVLYNYYMALVLLFKIPEGCQQTQIITIKNITMVTVTMKTNVRKKVTNITFTAETAKDFCQVLDATDFYGTGSDPIFEYIRNKTSDFDMTTSVGDDTKAILELTLRGVTDIFLEEIQNIIEQSEQADDYDHFVYICN
jgi:hypothetical protein